MVVVILTIFGIGLIIALACRIVMGWILPAQTVAAIDRGAAFATKLVIQLSIVGLAVIPLYAFFFASKA